MFTQELYDSLMRLETNQTHLAVWVDGSSRTVTGQNIQIAWNDGAMVFSPQEMWAYLQMDNKGRELMRRLKSLRPAK